MKQEQPQWEGKKKVKHGPTGFNCQYKLSSGESCQRLLAEEWKETEWREERERGHHAISPTATLHPSHATFWLPKPWQHVHRRYSYTKFTTPLPGSLIPPPLCLYLFYNSSLFLIPHLRSGWDVHNKSSLQILTATLNPGSALVSQREGLHCTF